MLVAVRAAGVNPIDVAVRRNSFPTPKQPPKTIGSDGAGVVEAIGPDVDGVRPATRSSLPASASAARAATPSTP